MCEKCGWSACLSEIDDALESAALVDSEEAEEFVESVTKRLKGIRLWIEEHRHATAAQETAVENMAVGIAAWQS